MGYTPGRGSTKYSTGYTPKPKKPKKMSKVKGWKTLDAKRNALGVRKQENEKWTRTYGSRAKGTSKYRRGSTNPHYGKGDT